MASVIYNNAEMVGLVLSMNKNNGPEVCLIHTVDKEERWEVMLDDWGTSFTTQEDCLDFLRKLTVIRQREWA